MSVEIQGKELQRAFSSTACDPQLPVVFHRPFAQLMWLTPHVQNSRCSRHTIFIR